MRGRGLILALLTSGFAGAMGCATSGATTALPAPAGVRARVERVVFDDDPAAARLRVTGPSTVTIGWRIDVTGPGVRGHGARSVEWVYEEVPAERADDETTPPPQVAARARLLAAHLQPAAAVTSSVAAR